MMGSAPIDTESRKQAFAYLLHYADGSLYAGWTFDLEQRIQTHNEGKGSRYTRTRLPVHLVASWTFQSKTEAMRFEWQIKRMSRAQKLALCERRTADES